MPSGKISKTSKSSKTTKTTKKSAPKKAKENVKKTETKKADVKKKVTKSTASKTASKKTVAKKTATKTAPKKQTVKAKPTKKKATSKKKAPYTPEELLKTALKVLSDRQAQDVVEFDLEGCTAIADYAVVASGTSNRHLSAMADYIRRAFRDLGVKNIQIEGLEKADWVLLDAGDVLVHLFRPEVREYYQIEDIWSVTKPKKVK